MILLVITQACLYWLVGHLRNFGLSESSLVKCLSIKTETRNLSFCPILILKQLDRLGPITLSQAQERGKPLQKTLARKTSWTYSGSVRGLNMFEQGGGGHQTSSCICIPFFSPSELNKTETKKNLEGLCRLLCELNMLDLRWVLHG